ncbi:MAG: ABC transporter ATP-binding protein [Bacteroidota bacterium]
MDRIHIPTLIHMIEVEALSFSYRDHQIFDQIGFALEPKKIYGLIGPNGVGKTTLISILAGIQNGFSGLVRNVQQPGLLLQGVGFYDNLTVEDNLSVFQRDQGAKPTDIAQVLSLVQMKDYAKVKYVNLSQGYKQRLGIARSLLTNGNLVLLDEPFTAVDVQTVRILKQAILAYVAQSQKTVVISSHQLKTIEDLIDQPLMIKAKKVRMPDLGRRQVRENLLYLWMDQPESLVALADSVPALQIQNQIDNILEIRLQEGLCIAGLLSLLSEHDIQWKRLDKEMPLEFFYFDE